MSVQHSRHSSPARCADAFEAASANLASAGTLRACNVQPRRCPAQSLDKIDGSRLLHNPCSLSPPRLSTFVAPVRNEVVIRGSMTSQQKCGYAFSRNDSKLQSRCNLQAMPLASEDNVTSSDQTPEFRGPGFRLPRLDDGEVR